MNIGFIGLGVMGGPISANLARQRDMRVAGFDVDPQKRAALGAAGGIVADSVSEAVRDADVVLTSLPGPRQVADVAFAETGLFASIAGGATWIDLSTNDLPTCRRIEQQANAQGVGYLDAPVSGGDEGARAGTLAIFVGGSREVYDRHRRVFETIGEQTRYLGDSGAGYSAKIAQVILCYLHSLALSEALMLGIKGGVDPQEMLSIIQGSTGRSYVADRYGPPILAGDYDPSFTVGLAHKDMKLAMEMAASLGIELPMSQLTTETYARAIESYGFDANHLRAVRLLEETNETFLQS